MAVSTIMASPALGAWVAFQVTATRVFISAPLMGATANHYGRLKIIGGASLGIAALIVAAVLLYSGLTALANSVIVAISAIILVSLALYLACQFGIDDNAQYRDYPYAGVLPEPHGLARKKGWTIALWIMIVEGLIILPAWLSIAVRSRPIYPSTGVAAGVVVGGIVGLLMKHDKLDAEGRSLLSGLLMVVIAPYGFYQLVAIVVHQL